MLPLRRRGLDFSCSVTVVVLAGLLACPGLGQTANPPEHAVYVESSGVTADTTSPSTAKHHRAPSHYAYPYGGAYHYRYGYGWSYPTRPYDGYAYGTPHRLRTWGPYGSPFIVPGRSSRGPWIDDDYRQWRYADRTRQSKKRTKRLLESHRKMMSQGLAAFAKGDYERARSAFVLAADMNHGDAASRIHAAHGCFALGRYGQAVRWLREAFHLEPRLCDLPYDIRTDYGDPKDFEAQLSALKGSIAALPDEPDPLILLGYVSFYAGQRAEAHDALVQARRRLGDQAAKDHLVTTLVKASEPSRFVARKKDG